MQRSPRRFNPFLWVRDESKASARIDHPQTSLLTELGQPVLSTLIGALAVRKLVLLLDNCEHLIEACGRIVDQLIRRCPNLHLLATSREPLNIAGERTWRVPPLQLADPDQLPNMESHLSRIEAIA